MLESSNFDYKIVDGRSLRWIIEDAGYKFKDKEDFLNFESLIDGRGVRLYEYKRYSVKHSTLWFRLTIPLYLLIYLLIVIFCCFRWLFTGEFKFSKDVWLFKITDKWYNLNHKIEYGD